MKTSLTLVIIFISFNTFAQLPGKKFKTPYKCVDNHDYKVGETIKLGVPSKGKMFEQITLYKKTSLFETLSAVASTASDVSMAVATKGRVISSSSDTNTPQSPFTLVDHAFSNQTAVIDYFSYYEDKKNPKNNSTFVVAKMVSDPNIVIAFNMELAVKNGEMYSNNADYQQVKTAEQPASQTDTVALTQFSSKIHAKFLGITGNRDKQTVTVNLLLSHKQVHQKIRIRTRENSAYDLDGNEYKSSFLSIGSQFGEYDESNKIPTGVPVKVTVTFNKILPEVKLLRFVSIKIYYDDDANGAYTLPNEGLLEIKNAKINWQ